MTIATTRKRFAGVRALGSALGERRLSAAELAGTLGLTEEDIRRSSGNMTIHVSDLSAPELGAEAARRCLAQVGLEPEAIDVVIWGRSGRWSPEEGRRELHLQHLLGATNANAIALDSPSCAELVTALRLARSFIEEGSAANVLVVMAETWKGRRLYGFGANGLGARAYQPILSDGAAAILIQADRGHPILGFGEASMGKYWDFVARLETGKGLDQGNQTPQNPWNGMSPERVALMVDSVALHRKALLACLARCGRSNEAIQHVLMTREGHRVPAALMRQLRLPEERYFAWPDGPTHVGLPDCLLALEALLTSGRAQPGELVLLAPRAVGTIRCALLGLETSP
jgi:3-oxoacyl-[acyl-carrier-protein] synthase-3